MEELGEMSSEGGQDMDPGRRGRGIFQIKGMEGKGEVQDGSVDSVGAI